MDREGKMGVETMFIYECADCGCLIRDTYHLEDRECPGCGGTTFDRRERLWFDGRDPREGDDE